ncbi:alpha/beta fold hydrolase [Amycolatopsis sp. NPDC051045]|uniref:thioesterase II family protein n=1 Tax=Amycolatopsis sp. NPDC051045 TaxID=3156922 RepID=UPI003417796D
MPDNDKWIVRVRRAPGTPRLTLICFAYAGGSPHLFRSWARGWPADVDVLALRLPGHDVRRREQPYTEWKTLVDDVSAVLAPHLSVPHAFYGHSFGARVAYELAHRAEPTRTARVFVSGCRSPDWPQARPFLHDLTDAELLGALRAMGGTAPEVLGNSSVMDVVLPTVRAEIRLAELWGDAHERALAAPITAIYGRDDAKDTHEAMRGWISFGGAGTEVVGAPGGHFFPDTHRADLLTIIDARIGRDHGHD